MLNCDALYYPFSRCIDATVLKQFLLLFDSLTFLDPVDDEGWREQLFQDVEYEDARYAQYRDLAGAMPWLRSQGIISIRSPDSLHALNENLTVAATLGDLSDSQWVQSANPDKHGLPTQRFAGKPCWNIFKPKIPDGVVSALIENDLLRNHLLYEGGDRYAWQLSYAAGSSIGINVHLAAADELSLAPVTDSKLHHYLMLQKLQRGSHSPVTPEAFDQVAEMVAQRAVFNIVKVLLPKEKLELLSLEDVIRFRAETNDSRREFLQDAYRIVAGEIDPQKPAQSEQIVHRVTQRLVDRARAYESALDGAREKLWPKLMDALTSPITIAGTTAALAASFITGSAHVLLASAVLPAVKPMKAIVDWQVDRNAARKSETTSIAYLSQVSSLASR